MERVVAFASSRGTSRPACHNHGMCAGFVACTCKRRVFATFEQEATEEIAKVLAWRKDATSQAGLAVDVVVLPFTLQKQLQARHYQHWVEGPQKAEDFSRCKRGTSDTMSAHLVDRYRSWCIDTFRGLNGCTPLSHWATETTWLRSASRRLCSGRNRSKQQDAAPNRCPSRQEGKSLMRERHPKPLQRRGANTEQRLQSRGHLRHRRPEQAAQTCL